MSVPGLWTVTPFSPGWKTVVYPSSDSFLTLAKNVLSPGSTSASRAAFVSCSKGSRVLFTVVNIVLSGKYTSLFDGPVFGKSSSALMKCDVAPESMIILCSRCFAFHPSNLLVHLFPALSSVSCIFFLPGVFMLLICSSSPVLSSSWIVYSGPNSL